MEHLGRILVVEPDPSAADVFLRECTRLRRTTVLRSASDAMDVLDTAPKLTAVISEQVLADGGGLTVLKAYRATYPRVPMLMITAETMPRLINGCHLIGAEFVAKPTRRRNLRAFLQRAVAFERVPDRRVACVVGDLVKSCGFSPRETDVLAAAIQGIPRKVVADQIGTTENTVKSCIRSLLRKCDLGSLEELGRVIWMEALAGSDVYGSDAEATYTLPPDTPFTIQPPGGARAQSEPHDVAPAAD